MITYTSALQIAVGMRTCSDVPYAGSPSLPDQEKYLSLSEEDILAILREQVLSDDEFAALTTKLITKLEK